MKATKNQFAGIYEICEERRKLFERLERLEQLAQEKRKLEQEHWKAIIQQLNDKLVNTDKN
jgi:hypothetical protein